MDQVDTKLYKPKQTFSVEAAFTYGWEMYKKNKSFFLKVSVIIIAAMAVLYSLMFLFEVLPDNRFTLLFTIAIQLAGAVFGIGIIKFFLAIYDGRPLLLETFSPGLDLVLKFVGASIVAWLATTAGMFLLVVPGIMLAFGLSQYMYILVDQGGDPIDSLKKSWEISRGAKWKIFVFQFASGLIVLAGFLALLVGLLVAIPVVTLAQIYVYKELNRQYEINIKNSGETPLSLESEENHGE